MITYAHGRWGIALIFQLRGSVGPKACVWAVPSAITAVLLHLYLRGSYLDTQLGSGIGIGFGGFTSAMGFLLVFRTQQAYARWWEGGTLLQTVRGEWFNAYSSLLAFSSRDVEKRFQVRTFQHLLLRLMSLLYCAALQQVSTSDANRFEIIHLEGMEIERLEFLQNSKDRCEIILHWIQRLIVKSRSEGTITVEAPLLAMVFQQLSRGSVNIDDARKIREFPFPFPYAQMMTGMLLIHWVMTPFLMASLCDDWCWAGVLTFITVFILWNMNYVATAIESPFGDGTNDLPLLEMQREFNNSLTTLLMREAQSAPDFSFSHVVHQQVRVQSVEQNRLADPSYLKQSLSHIDASDERVLTVLRNLSDDLSLHARAPELPRLVHNAALRKATLLSLFTRRRTHSSSSSSFLTTKTGLASAKMSEDSECLARSAETASERRAGATGCSAQMSVVSSAAQISASDRQRGLPSLSASAARQCDRDRGSAAKPWKSDPESPCAEI